MDTNEDNKTIVREFWQALDGAAADRARDIARRHADANLLWHGPDPIGELRGTEAFARDFWMPLRESFPDLERREHLFFGGRSNGRIDGLQDGRMWVCGTGLFNATFARDYLAIPATGTSVGIRWGEFCRVESGKIVEIYFLLDLVDLMRQAGFAVLPPSRGSDGIWPAPRAGDGIVLQAQDEAESQRSLEHIRQFIFDGLNSYDQANLGSMGMAGFFHPDVQWYGPGGIGACDGLHEFESLHQAPWLRGFPDRRVQDLDALFAEGAYSGAPGWAGVRATHTGEYLDCPATGADLEINGLDFWKRDGDVYIENWVFVDMIHLFRQMGVDLFERLAARKALA